MKFAVIALIIGCWSTIAFLFRLSAKKGASRLWVSAGAAASWLLLILLTMIATRVDAFSAPPGLYVAGALGGIALAAVMPLIMGAVSRGNLAVSWTILTLSFAAVALLGIGYPGERVTVSGVVGLAVAAAAIALLGWDSVAAGSRGGFKRGWGLFMALAFAANTLALYVFTLAKAWGRIDEFPNKIAFLLAQTTVFLVASAALCASRPAGGTKLTAVAIGAGVGMFEYVGNFASVIAMGNLNVPGYVFFPATTGGSTLAVAFVSAVFVGERPGPRGWLGLALGLAAMVLLGGSA
jgi:drug/metabolite transporter (DMT)-like permease